MKILHLFILFLLTITKSYSQLTYDFNKGMFLADGIYFKDGNVLPQPTSGFAVLKIKNINTFRWKVAIQGKSIDYVTPVPSELQTLFRLPDQTDSQKKTSEGETSINDAAYQMATKKIESDQTVKDLEKNISTLENKVDSLGKLGIPAKDINKQKTENQDKKTVAQNKKLKAEKFQAAMVALTNACDKYTKIARIVAKVKFLKTDLVNISKGEYKDHDAMKIEIANLTTKTFNDSSFPFSGDKAQLVSIYNAFITSYEDAEKLYEKAIETARETGTGKDAAAVKTALDKLEEGHNKINEDGFLSLIEDTAILYQAMINSSSFDVISAPIQMDGDFVHFDVNISTDQINTLQNYVTGKAFPIDIPAKGGWKADFSVGPVFSLGSNAIDDRFYLKQISQTTSDSINGRLVKSNNSSVVFPAVAAMFHAYKRSGKQFNWGIMMGVGAGFKSTSDINASYYIGPTFVLGKQQKTMFSFGASFLPVDRLKSKYTEGAPYKISSFNTSDVTEKTILSSFFFGISYNLTNRVDVK